MMWNWLITGLATGATLMLYDGSPFAPTPDVLWDYAQDERINVFGTSAKYIDACSKAGLAPARHTICLHVRMITSTGSPLGAGKLRVRLSRHQIGRAPGLDLRRHRHRVVLRARRSDLAGLEG